MNTQGCSEEHSRKRSGVSLDALLVKLRNVSPLLHAKNTKILELFSDFRMTEPSIPGVRGGHYVLPSAVSISLLLCAAESIVKHHTQSVPVPVPVLGPVPAVLTPSCTTIDAAAILHRTFCTGSVRTRISLLSCLLSLGGTVQPEHARAVRQYGEKGCEALLSHYLSEGSFLLPSWLGCGGKEEEVEGAGCSAEIGRGNRQIACGDVYRVSLEALSSPSFVHSLLLFGVFNSDNAAQDHSKDKEGVCAGRGSIGGGFRSSRKSAKEIEENAAAEALRLSRLSLSLLDPLLRCARARCERELESGMHSREQEGTRALAAVWGPALPLLKQVEWRSCVLDMQREGEGEGGRRGEKYGQSTISLFVQMLEDINYRSGSSSSYGRSMVLGLFHMSPHVRASSALRLRHELSGLQAPCEAAVQHTDR